VCLPVYGGILVVGFFALRVFVLFCFVFPLKVHYTVLYRPVLYGTVLPRSVQASLPKINK